MDLGIKGKVAFVAAASRGLGRAVAQELAAEGASLVLCARNAETLNLVSEQIAKTSGVFVLGVTADVSAAEDAARAVKVFFHSHLDCGAYFSAEDAASMTLGGTSDPSFELSYLVTAVDQGEVTAHKLFIWSAASKSASMRGQRSCMA